MFDYHQFRNVSKAIDVLGLHFGVSLAAIFVLLIDVIWVAPMETEAESASRGSQKCCTRFEAGPMGRVLWLSKITPTSETIDSVTNDANGANGANGAAGKANCANVVANGAYGVANSAYGVANGAYGVANGANGATASPKPVKVTVKNARCALS